MKTLLNTQIQLKNLVMRQLPMETIKNTPSLRVTIYAPQNIKLETHSQSHSLHKSRTTGFWQSVWYHEPWYKHSVYG